MDMNVVALFAEESSSSMADAVMVVAFFALMGFVLWLCTK